MGVTLFAFELNPIARGSQPPSPFHFASLRIPFRPLPGFTSEEFSSSITWMLCEAWFFGLSSSIIINNNNNNNNNNNIIINSGNI